MFYEESLSCFFPWLHGGLYGMEEQAHARASVALLEEGDATATTVGGGVSAFPKEEVERYSRQLLVPEIGVAGHSRLAASAVLVVGCGGLGSPAALYLAGAGVGRLGLMDADQVESSNLHRQIMHTEGRSGVNKAESGAEACRQLNSRVPVEVHRSFLTADNALDTIAQYDIVLDASDNVATRYLVNDACVMLGKPLVYGSALRMEGQLAVYNYKGGPCYRCVFPTPPPMDTVTDCSDGGIVGPVVGVIGTLQAMEVIKVACNHPADAVMSGRMLMYSAATCAFRNIRLRHRRADCAVCGDDAVARRAASGGLVLQQEPQTRGPTDACAATHAEGLPEAHRASCSSYVEARSPNTVLIDVRDATQFAICHLPEAVNIPLSSLEQQLEQVEDACLQASAQEVFVICRRGIFSHEATKKLLDRCAQGFFTRR